MTDLANINNNTDRQPYSPAEGTSRQRQSAGFSLNFEKIAAPIQAIDQFVGPAIDGALRLDAALGQLSATLPGTAEDMALLERAAIDFAQAFGTSEVEQINGFYQAVAGGANDAEAAIKVMLAANQLAIGGSTETAIAVGVLSDALNAFADYGLTAADAADILVTGVNLGNTTFEQLAAGLAGVIPGAADLGVTFSDLVATVAALTQEGLTTQSAISGLSGVFEQLLAPSEQALTLAQELGIEFSAAGLQAEGLAGFLEQVEHKTGGSSEQMALLFGSVDSARVAMRLAGEDTTTLTDALTRMEERSGAAADQFAEHADRISEQWNRAMGNIDTLSNRAGNALLTVLAPAAEGVTDVLVGAEDANIALEAAIYSAAAAYGVHAVRNLALFKGAVTTVNQSVAAYRLSLAMIGPTATAANVATTTLSAATTGLGRAMGLVLTPAGAVGAAVAALTVAWGVYNAVTSDARERQETLNRVMEDTEAQYRRVRIEREGLNQVLLEEQQQSRETLLAEQDRIEQILARARSRINNTPGFILVNPTGSSAFNLYLRHLTNLEERLQAVNTQLDQNSEVINHYQVKIADVADGAGDAASIFESLSDALGRLGESGGASIRQSFESLIGSLPEDSELIAPLQSLLSQINRLADESNDRQSQALDRHASARDDTDREIRNIQRLTEALRESVEERDHVAAAIEREELLRNEGFEAFDEERQLRDEQLDNLQAVREEYENLETSIEAQAEAEERALLKSQSALRRKKEGALQAAQDAQNQLESLQAQVDQTTSQVSQRITDGLFDGFEGQLDDLETLLRNWARDLIIQPVIRPLVEGYFTGDSGSNTLVKNLFDKTSDSEYANKLAGLKLANETNVWNQSWDNFLTLGNTPGQQLGDFLVRIGEGTGFGQHAGFLHGVGHTIGSAAPYAAIGSYLSGAIGIQGSGNQLLDGGLSLGGAIGGQFLGGKIGVLGAAGGPLGAVIGSVLGTALAGLFRDEDYPYARSDIQIRDGRAVRVGGESLDGGGLNGADKAVIEAINSALGALGVSSDFTGGGTTFGVASGRSGALGDGFFAGADGGFATGATFTNIEDAEEAAKRAVAFAISQAIENGALGDAFGENPAERAMEVFRNNDFDIDASVADLNFIQNFEDTLTSLEESTEAFGDSVRANVKAQIDATLNPLREFRDRAEELGLSSERSDEAIRSFVEGLLGLNETESLNSAEVAIEALNAKFDELVEAADEFGVSLEQVEEGRQREMDALREGFSTGIEDQIRALTENRITTQINAIISTFTEGMDVSATLDVDSLLVTRRGIVQLLKAVEAATPEDFDALAAALEDLPAELEPAGQAVRAWMAEVQQATSDQEQAVSDLSALQNKIAAEQEAARLEAQLIEANANLMRSVYNVEANRLREIAALQNQADQQRIAQLENEARLFQSAAQQIDQFLGGLSFSTVSPVSLTDQFAEAQTNFDRTLAAARDGDAEAAARLTQDADRLLGLNAQINRSGVAGSSLFDQVRAALSGVQSDAERRGERAGTYTARTASAVERQLEELRDLLGVNDDGFGSVRSALEASAEAAAAQGLTLEEFLASNADALDVLERGGFADAGEFARNAFEAALEALNLEEERKAALEEAEKLARAATEALEQLLEGEGLSGRFDEILESLDAVSDGIKDTTGDIVASLSNAARRIDAAVSSGVDRVGEEASQMLEGFSQQLHEIMRSTEREIFERHRIFPVNDQIPIDSRIGGLRDRDLINEINRLREELVRSSEFGNRLNEAQLNQLSELGIQPVMSAEARLSRISA